MGLHRIGNPDDVPMPCLRCGLNVLVDSKEVSRIELGLHGRKSVVIVAVAVLHPVLAFIHHEIDVGTAG